MKATEQYFPVVLSVYYAVQGGSNFWVWGWHPKVWPFKWKLLSSTFLGTVYYAVQGGSYFLALLTNMPLCKNNHTMAQTQTFSPQVTDSKQFSKKSFSSTEEERASDDKTILNVTIIFLVYLENFVNNFLDKKYSLSSAEM